MFTNVTTKTKCDVRDCKNDAAFSFEVKGKTGKCFLCTRCLAALSAEGRANVVPKSPQNAIKRRLELKQREENDVKR